MRMLCGGVILWAAVAPASAQADPPTVETVLAANRDAMAPQPSTGALHAEYRLEANGLVGASSLQQDLASGAFAWSMTTGPVSESRGFDGRTPWQREVSGVATDQEGGDRLVVAVNAAYRNANLWWRSDRGGARIAYVGREPVEGRPADHLAVTPRGGGPFDAWFDAATHLLVRTAEPQQFFATRTLYGDYRAEDGAMVAHTRTVDFGTGPASVERYTLTKLEIGPSRPPSAYGRPEAPPRGGRILGEARSVTVPFRLLNNHVYVEVSVNGEGPYTFLVDTGGHTLISPQVARATGLEVVGQGSNSGAGEKTSSTGYARYREIALGDVRLTDQTAFITEIYDPAIEGISVDGMLGFELFARFAVRLDYGARTMTIMDFAAFDPKDAGVAVPFVFYDHLPFVRGFVDDVPATFDIDTGSRAEVDLTSPFVARQKLRERYQRGVNAITGWGVGGPARSYVVRTPSLTLGTVTGKAVVAGLSEAKHGSFSDPAYDGNIGSGYLKRYVVTFDYAQKSLYLKPLDPAPADAGRFDRSGLWINAADRGFTVTSVAAGSPAAEAGLETGDLITTVDGAPARREALSDARMALRVKPPGAHVALDVERAGSTRRVVLVLRDLI